MKYLALALLLFPSICLAEGTFTKHSFYSGTLKRPYNYNIYLPEDYHESCTEYPTVYLLHGAYGNCDSWIDNGRIAGTITSSKDEGETDFSEMIIVMPEDPNFWWADSQIELALTALTEDLTNHIDMEYRTICEKKGRAIVGYSSGGFGAANAALKRPDLYEVAAILSPAVYHPLPPDNSSATKSKVFETEGKFDPSKWYELGWFSKFNNYKRGASVVSFYINSGDHDRYETMYHAMEFYKVLRSHQPENVELRIFDGDHNFKAWGVSVKDALVYITQKIGEK